MIILSKEKDAEIRNRLDVVQELLYHDVAPYGELYWMHKTMKELLFMIYLLQQGKDGEKDESG